MTAINKRYVANNRQNLQIVVNLPESKGQVTITFNSGYGLRREAYFMTTDETIQSALEGGVKFNKSYRLEEINNVTVAEYEARKAIKETMEQENKTAPEDTPPPADIDTNTDGQKDIVKKEFDNVDSAKKWLNKDHKISFTHLGNKTIIIAKALELGFELSFKTDKK